MHDHRVDAAPAPGSASRADDRCPRSAPGRRTATGRCCPHGASHWPPPRLPSPSCSSSMRVSGSSSMRIGRHHRGHRRGGRAAQARGQRNALVDAPSRNRNRQLARFDHAPAARGRRCSSPRPAAGPAPRRGSHLIDDARLAACASASRGRPPHRPRSPGCRSRWRHWPPSPAQRPWHRGSALTAALPGRPTGAAGRRTRRRRSLRDRRPDPARSAGCCSSARWRSAPRCR